MSITVLQRLWGLRKPRRLASVILRRLGLSHRFTIRTSGVRLKFFPAVWTINLWESPDFFRHDTELLRRWLRPGDVMIDCGANVGLLTLVAADQVGPEGVVYSIEAHPRTFRYLRENVALNEATNVQLFQCAVGEREATITFSDQPGDDGNHVVSGNGLTVPMRPLDAIVPDVPVRLFKLDVEGYEKFVFEGGARALRASECVYFESSSYTSGRYGYRPRDLYELLVRAGFQLTRPEGNGDFRLLSLDYDSPEIENLLAIRDVEAFARHTGYRVV